METQNKPQSLFKTPLQFLLDIFYLIAGGVLIAMAINSLLIPQQFATGGLNGIALIIYKLIPIAEVGKIYIILNIPLFVLAWMTVGRRFFVYSIIGTITLTLSLMYVHIPIELDDKMLNALLAGLIIGLGAGISLRSVGSLGGMDLLSVILLKRFSISIGTTILVTNAFVLLLVAYSFSLESVIYTMIVLFVSSKIVDVVLNGLSKRKAVIIISPQYEKIEELILNKLERGVTVLQGTGGYTGQQEHILYTVVTMMELRHLKKLIVQVDPDAFVVINNTLEVMNYRIGNQPHW